MLEWRNFVCGMMIVIVPASLAAQATDRALLQSDGGVWVNGSLAQTAIAIFPDDVIQTARDHTAKLDVAGSTVVILPESVVEFQANELVLDHGSLHLNTSRQLRVRVHCLTVTPILAAGTQYDVTDTDGKVKIIAYKNDVKVNQHKTESRTVKETETQTGNSGAIVREGTQTSRSEHCGAVVEPVRPGIGPLLNSREAVIGGLGVIALSCILVCPPREDPISPWVP